MIGGLSGTFRRERSWRENNVLELRNMKEECGKREVD